MIIAAILITLWLGFAIDGARRLAWSWNEKEREKKRIADAYRTVGDYHRGHYHDSYSDAQRRLGAMVAALLFPPSAYLMAGDGTSWDKAPKAVRQQQQIDAQKREIERLERELEIGQ